MKTGLFILDIVGKIRRVGGDSHPELTFNSCIGGKHHLLLTGVSVRSWNLRQMQDLMRATLECVHRKKRVNSLYCNMFPNF